MISSMTAFGTARVAAKIGWVNVELRSLNHRGLDLHLHVTDELRQFEGMLRERLARAIKRGKVDARISAQLNQPAAHPALNTHWLAHLAAQLQTARQFMIDVRAPTLMELLQSGQTHPVQTRSEDDSQNLEALCLHALHAALSDFQKQRQREGTQLALAMLGYAQHIREHIDWLEAALPQMQAAWRERLDARLRSLLETASPQGWTHISGEELSARISQETLLYSLRVDAAEELTRLRVHVQELQRLLGGTQKPLPEPPKPPGHTGKAGSTSKRLEFLFQEMNREANTLGAKSATLEQTRTAMSIKLLIEQLREQTQNIL